MHIDLSSLVMLSSVLHMVLDLYLYAKFLNGIRYLLALSLEFFQGE